MKGAVEAETFSLTITCSQSFFCFVHNFVCIIRDGLHTLRVMATLGVGGNCAFLADTTKSSENITLLRTRYDTYCTQLIPE